MKMTRGWMKMSREDQRLLLSTVAPSGDDEGERPLKIRMKTSLYTFLLILIVF